MSTTWDQKPVTKMLTLNWDGCTNINIQMYFLTDRRPTIYLGIVNKSIKNSITGQCSCQRYNPSGH